MKIYILILFSILPTLSFAKDKVVVVPLFDTQIVEVETPSTRKNIVVKNINGEKVGNFVETYPISFGRFLMYTDEGYFAYVSAGQGVVDPVVSINWSGANCTGQPYLIAGGYPLPLVTVIVQGLNKNLYYSDDGSGYQQNINILSQSRTNGRCEEGSFVGGGYPLTQNDPSITGIENDKGTVGYPSPLHIGFD